MHQTKQKYLLSEIKPGQRVVVVGIEEDRIPLKLLEMGMLPGNEIFVKRWAPMQDPIHIEIAGFDLALRKDEAVHVFVTKVEPVEAVL